MKQSEALVAENAKLQPIRNSALATGHKLGCVRLKPHRSADALHFNEEETRKHLIDTMLLVSGW